MKKDTLFSEVYALDKSINRYMIEIALDQYEDIFNEWDPAPFKRFAYRCSNCYRSRKCASVICAIASISPNPSCPFTSKPSNLRGWFVFGKKDVGFTTV